MFIASPAVIFGSQKGRWAQRKEGGVIAVPSGGHEGNLTFGILRYKRFYCLFLPTLNPHLTIKSARMGNFVCLLIVLSGV